MPAANEIQNFLGIKMYSGEVNFKVLETEKTIHYERKLISYSGSEADEIRAFLFLPTKNKTIGAVLVHHQHNGERHIGKSEIAGIVGDPLQAFGPALAEKGLIVLAPDSISFEDRRTNKKGIEEDDEPDNDWLQHYNEMAYRLLRGDLLMKKVVEDSSIAISLLSQLEETPEDKIGILGHSYGGNTVLFHVPFDDRIKFSCSSGAVCSYKTKFAHQTGIELAEVIPGFVEQYDIPDLLKAIHPRPMLIVAGEQDLYAQDAAEIFDEVKTVYEASGHEQCIQLLKVKGEHGLNEERFDFIVDWFVSEMTK